MTARFVNLSRRLLLAGLSPRRVRRLIGELESHFDDLVAEQQAAGLSRAASEARAAAQLGSEEALFASIAARPELRSWALRWPWAAFAALPLLALVLEFLLSIFAMIGVASFSLRVLGVDPVRSRVVIGICEALAINALWVAPMIAAGAACVLAARRRVPVLWPIVGCILIALVGSATNAGVDWHHSVPHGVLSAGIGVPWSGARGPAVQLRFAVTLLAGLAPYLWLTHSANRASRRAVQEDL